MSMVKIYIMLGCSFVLAMSLIGIAKDFAMIVAIATSVFALGHFIHYRLKGSTNASHSNRKTPRNNFFRRDDL